MRSVHSRRTVLTQRSAKAFARGACGGVLITSMPAAANTVSKAVVNFASRSRRRNRTESVRSSRSIGRFRACWATDAPAGCAVTPHEVHPAGGYLEEVQHV